MAIFLPGLCLATRVFPLINLKLHSLYSELFLLFIFSDLLTIDEKLFSSNCPPLDALPLYLSHFQFIESSDDEVKLSLRIVCVQTCVGDSSLLSVFFFVS